MTIEQAIEHAEEVANEKFKTAEFIKNNPYGDKSKIQGCVECAEEHRQLAAWLRELQERRKEPEIITCRECKHYKPMSSDWGNCYVHGSPTELHRTCQSCDYCSWAERRTDD